MEKWKISRESDNNEKWDIFFCPNEKKNGIFTFPIYHPDTFRQRTYFCAIRDGRALQAISKLPAAVPISRARKISHFRYFHFSGEFFIFVHICSFSFISFSFSRTPGDGPVGQGLRNEGPRFHYARHRQKKFPFCLSRVRNLANAPMRRKSGPLDIL